MTQAAGQAFYPILPSWEYVADPEPRVFGAHLYIYGSHVSFDGVNTGTVTVSTGRGGPAAARVRWT